MKNKCLDYDKCESKKCRFCQRNAKIRMCACCGLVYIGRGACPFCEFASYGAYFVLGSWFKVFWRLIRRTHLPKENISYMN